MRGRDVAIVIGAVVLIVLLFGLLGGGMMMGPGMMGWGYGFNPLGWIVMLLLWALIISGIALLAIWLIREAGPSMAAPTGYARAIDILKERYARGEITREQYEEMRREIEGR